MSSASGLLAWMAARALRRLRFSSSSSAMRSRSSAVVRRFLDLDVVEIAWFDANGGVVR